MNWNLAIERNREALKRILGALVAMAALPVLLGRGELAGRPTTGAGPAASGSSRPLDAHATGMTDIGLSPKIPASLPRHLHRAVLRLLRPAEAAARRLVIVAARGLVVPAPRRPSPASAPKMGKTSVILRVGPRGAIGTGIVMPRVLLVPPPSIPPHEGKGAPGVAPGHPTDAPSGNAAEFPSPVWRGVKGGGKDEQTRSFRFQLFDPLRRPTRDRRAAKSGVPRICFPGFSQPFPVPPAPTPDDPIDAGRLGLRLLALASALDDLPAHARRFARWQAARDATVEQNRNGAAAAQNELRGKKIKNRLRRTWPLRPGRPPGGRQRHAVHDVLTEIHGLALSVLERPDTS